MKTFLKFATVAVCELWFSNYFAFAIADKDGPQLGAVPPALALTGILQGPSMEAVSWDKLEGKVVVLEFWATWCGPCVQTISHLNTLAEQFKDKPVVFLAVTTENKDVVRSFLKQHPIRAWVGLDHYEALNKAFHVSAIPHALIINAEGRIAAIAHPADIESRHLEEVLSGKKCSLPEPTVYTVSKDSSSNVISSSPPALFEISIREHRMPPKIQGPVCTWSRGPDGCEFEGKVATIESALRYVFQKTPSRVSLECQLPEGFYAFRLRAPAGHRDELERQFIAALQTTFDLEVKRMFREMDAYVLTQVTTNAPGLRPATKEGGGGEITGGFDLRGSQMEWVVQFLERPLRQPVIDETGLQGLFTVHLKWEMSEAELLLRRVDYKVVEALEKNPTQKTLESLSPGLLKGDSLSYARALLAEFLKPERERFRPNPEAVIKAVREQLGLKLETIRRTIEVLEVRKTESPPQK